MIVGPHGLGWVDHNELDILAEAGVVLLMFTLGIEFSFDRIKRIKSIALGGGTLQIGLTVLVGVGTALMLGWTWYRGVYMGCLVALSSSAIVLKLLQESGQLDTLHGRTALGLLLFQDLAVVPMMIVLPALASSQPGTLMPLAIAGGKAIVFLGGALLLSRLLLPSLFFQIARTQSRELFLLMVLTLCFGTAWISHLAGLSLALGAFVAGVVISNSEYSLRILSDVLPFKDTFLSIFFISVGMLLYPAFVIAHPEILLLVVLLVLVVNFLISTSVVLLFKYPMRVAVFVGATLSQIGEFSFVLAQMGKGLGLIGEYLYQLTLAGTVITMTLTPQMMTLGRRLPDWLLRWGLPERMVHGKTDEDLEDVHLNDHVIVCGYGPIGRHVTKVLQEHKVPYLILELNAPRVRALRQKDVPIFYGDSTSPEVLNRAGLERAKVVVVTYADPHAARRTIAQVKALHPRVQALVRTRLPEDIAELRRLGAEGVIEEEFEVSLEMAAWTLNLLGLSRLTVDTELDAIRHDSYQIFTEPNADLTPLHRLIQNFPNIEIATCRVHPQSSLAGNTLGETHMRSHLGVTVLSVLGPRIRLFNPTATYRIQPGDVLTLIGEKVRVEGVQKLIESGSY